MIRMLLSQEHQPLVQPSSNADLIVDLVSSLGATAASKFILFDRSAPVARSRRGAQRSRRGARRGAPAAGAAVVERSVPPFALLCVKRTLPDRVQLVGPLSETINNLGECV